MGFFFFFEAEDGIRDYKVTGVQTCALPICVRLSRDTRGPIAHVHTAAAEVGQGIVTVCAQIARTELGVERVEVDRPDTTIGSAGSSSASRQTWMTGGAVLAACREVKAELLARARKAGRSPDDLGVLLDEPID